MMRSIIKTVAVCFMPMIVLLSVPNPANAGQAELKSGRYVTDGGWGELTITISKNGKVGFAITSYGANAHVCSLEGEVKNGKSVLKALEKDRPCIVTFHPRGHDIEVTDNEGVCQCYCGARAGFTGVYLKPEHGCRGEDIQSSRNRFKKLYDSRKYTQALATLDTMFRKCSRYIHWLEIAWIRNDLAITQYRLGEYEDCLRTLKPIEEDARKTEDELREFYPPADADNVIPVAKATRTNLGLCKKKAVKNHK
jgi:hypothetical protein